MRATILVLALTGCAWDQAMLPVAQPQVATRADPAASVVLQCDRLGLRSPEAQRLCVLRGIDRLGIDRGPTTGYAPIQILPYPYPPLAPGGPAIHVVPSFR